MHRGIALTLVALAVAIALIPSLPYGYYSVMRWVVFALCAWLSLHSHRTGSEGWTWIWGIIAGIYNPLFPVHANRMIWSIVNVATIFIVIWCSLKNSRSYREKQNGRKT